MNDQPFYRASVRARLRVQPGSPSFTPLKNAFGGFELTISDGLIALRAVGPLSALARLARTDRKHAPGEVTFHYEQIGSHGTDLRSSAWIILSHQARHRTTEVAVRPLDGNLPSMHNALARVGVRVVPPAL